MMVMYGNINMYKQVISDLTTITSTTTAYVKLTAI